ncbi:hypothetical protein CCP4SC76_7760011 [Gammaproteobacteria bacterium]
MNDFHKNSYINLGVNSEMPAQQRRYMTVQAKLINITIGVLTANLIMARRNLRISP